MMQKFRMIAGSVLPGCGADSKVWGTNASRWLAWGRPR
jgi:hypothetical protein